MDRLPGPLLLDGGDSINRGLLRFMPLAEGAGARLVDIAPQRRAGAIVGAISRKAGRLGKVLNFPTSSDYGLINATKIISGLSHWTICFWFRVASGFTTVSNGAFYSERAASGNDIVGVYGYSTNLAKPNNIYIVMRDDGGTLSNGGCSTTTASNDGNWHFVVATKAGTALSIYLDGRLEGTSTWSGTDTFTNAVDARIAGDAAGAEPGTGDYSGLRLFARALQPGEAARLYRDPWAGTLRTRRRVLATSGTQYSLTTDPLSYEYTVGDAGLGWGRRLDTEALAYEHAVGDAGFVVRRTLQAEAVAYGYTVPAVALNYYPAQAEGDTHDGFKRRSRRQRALDAAERRRREDAAEEALALRLALEAAMGEAVEAVEEAPQPVAEAVETATKQAARYVPLLAQGPSDDVLQAANEAIVALRSAVAAADRARMLAEDDEDVMMLLRAL